MSNVNLWWLNDESQQVLNKGYLLRGESVHDAIHRICSAAAKYYEGTKYEKDAYNKFKRNVENGWQSFSSPIWSNMGTSRGLPISCNNVHVGDSIDSIARKQSEVIKQTQKGAGTSSSWSEVRHRGAPITDNGKSSGAVSFMRMFDITMDVVSQGAVRRGAHAVYLDVDHNDFNEFLQIRDIGFPIQNLYFGACIPDYWMHDMINGDASKRQVWANILQSRKEKGMPYLFFNDTVNRNKPQIYKDRELKIHGSNLCFTGDTLVQTKEYGNIQFVDLVERFNKGEKITVYSVDTEHNQVESTVVNAFMTADSITELIQIEHMSGYVDKMTLDHRILLDDNTYMTAIDVYNKNMWHRVVQLDVTDAIDNVEIIKLIEPVEVYDLTVDNDLHNFTLGSSLAVHNCSEIALPSTETESFVCCLASMNLELYDEWKDTDAVKWAVLFLDAVMSDYIKKTENIPYMEESHNFSQRHRAIGLGVMGWHSLLQKRNIAFEDFDAMKLNNEIFKYINKEAIAASVELGEELGYAPIFEEGPTTDFLRRNTTVLAIAPTTSSSSILGGVSPGIEPYSSNYYKAGLAKGNFMRKNKYLDAKLTELGHNNDETWRNIMLNHGSVQHLDFLDEHTKKVFKTFRELSQLSIIQQAAQRQKYIDQMQSINLNIPTEMSPKDVHNIITTAWKLGVKSLYYQRSESASKELITQMVICNTCEA